MKHERWNSRAIMWPCKDCGHDVSPVRNGKRLTWGVSDKAWMQAGMKPQGKRPLGTGEFLCWECFVKRFESRMGRPPEVKDCQPFAYFNRAWVSKKEWRGWLRRRREWLRRRQAYQTPSPTPNARRVGGGATEKAVEVLINAGSRVAPEP